ncbi:MAG: hypothetical protein ACYCXF_02490 [Thermoleophilia bacterium]
MKIINAKVLALMTAGLIVLGSGFAAVSYAKAPAPGQSTVTQTAPEAKEAPDAKEAPNANEAADTSADVPGVGHQDSQGANVDHQFEGNE